jgi:hypothetical protein
MTARDEALKRLARLYPSDYVQLYVFEKGEGVGAEVNSRARSRALVKLTHIFPCEYRKLYETVVSEGYRRSHQ